MPKERISYRDAFLDLYIYIIQSSSGKRQIKNIRGKI